MFLFLFQTMVKTLIKLALTGSLHASLISTNSLTLFDQFDQFPSPVKLMKNVQMEKIEKTTR